MGERICKICGKSYASAYALDRHIKCVHEQIRDFACTRCDYRAAVKTHLDKHEKSVHDKTRDQECTQCNYKATTKSALDRHVRCVHLKEKYKCTLCNFEASQRWRLTRHTKKKHMNFVQMHPPNLNLDQLQHQLAQGQLPVLSAGVVTATPRVKRSRTVGTQTPGSWLQTQQATTTAAANPATVVTQTEFLNQPAFPGNTGVHFIQQQQHQTFTTAQQQNPYTPAVTFRMTQM